MDKKVKFEDLKLTPKEMKELAEGARRFVYVDEIEIEPFTREQEDALTAAAGEDTV